MARVVIIKLGGSVITDKSRRETVNEVAVRGIAKVLGSCDFPIIIVHGAGSFGHYYAEMFGINSKTETRSAEGVSKTRSSMAALNMKIIEILQEHGLQPYSFPPASLYKNGIIMPHWKRVIQEIISIGLIPTTYGDVILVRKGLRVISGDVITRDLAGLIRPERVVFASDVDGIFENIGDSSSMIKELDARKVGRLDFARVRNDVTGGMRAKVEEAVKIARMGVDVYFANGLKREELMKALKGDEDGGTIIRGVGRGK